MPQYRAPIGGSTPPVVLNLIILNVLMLLVNWLAQRTFRTDLNEILGLYYIGSEHFKPYQIATHMFMHGGLTHLFFNMFALWMFGRVLETVWGGQRFLFYYFVTGIGAVVIHTLVNYIHVSSIRNQVTPEQYQMVLNEGYNILRQSQNYADPVLAKLNLIVNIPTVGASGAVFGVLLAFGMLFPNTQLLLLFPPIPIKAKWLVIGYGGLELYLGLSQPGSNIAHFAHLGGMLFGFFLIKYWNKRKSQFY
jgi:membrane associated rhomboid family serine protease